MLGSVRGDIWHFMSHLLVFREMHINGYFRKTWLQWPFLEFRAAFPCSLQSRHDVRFKSCFSGPSPVDFCWMRDRDCRERSGCPVAMLSYSVKNRLFLVVNVSRKKVFQRTVGKIALVLPFPNTLIQLLKQVFHIYYHTQKM